MYNVLVLGATGFIGGQIAKAALHVGWSVSGFRRDPNATGQLQGLPIRWFEGDINDQNSLLAAMQGKDILFHAAGYYPPDNNPKSTEQYVAQAASEMSKVIQAAQQAKIKKTIYTSSLTTIGFPPQGDNRLADERDHYQQGSLKDNGYYETKIIQEQIALSAAEEGLHTVILNPTAVLGPGDHHLGVGQIILMIADGKVKAVPPGTINMIDVRDVAAAHVNAARTGKSGERYILGGDNYTIMEAVTRIASFLDLPSPWITLPAWSIDLYLTLTDIAPFLPHAPFHLKAFRYWQEYNTEKAVRELNLQTRLLEETIRDSIKWFSNQGKL